MTESSKSETSRSMSWRAQIAESRAPTPSAVSKGGAPQVRGFPKAGAPQVRGFQRRGSTGPRLSKGGAPQVRGFPKARAPKLPQSVLEKALRVSGSKGDASLKNRSRSL